MIFESPLTALIPKIKHPSVERPEDESESRTWESLGSVVAAFLVLLRVGEWHQETITTVARRVPHNLRRRPRALFWTMPADDSAFVYAPGGREAWDAETINLQASAGVGVTVEFVLI